MVLPLKRRVAVCLCDEVCPRRCCLVPLPSLGSLHDPLPASLLFLLLSPGSCLPSTWAAPLLSCSVVVLVDLGSSIAIHSVSLWATLGGASLWPRRWLLLSRFCHSWAPPPLDSFWSLFVLFVGLSGLTFPLINISFSVNWQCRLKTGKGF